MIWDVAFIKEVKASLLQKKSFPIITENNEANPG
jgi:hypothetical protein